MQTTIPMTNTQDTTLQAGMWLCGPSGVTPAPAIDPRLATRDCSILQPVPSIHCTATSLHTIFACAVIPSKNTKKSKFSVIMNPSSST